MMVPVVDVPVKKKVGLIGARGYVGRELLTLLEGDPTLDVAFVSSKGGAGRLAGEAIGAAWEEYRPKLDRVFSPSLPPLERIHRFCEFEFLEQQELQRQFGHVLGCPLCTLGTEVSTQEDALCRKVQAIMDQSREYLETTIRDAHADGLIHAPDAAAKARTVYAYTEGLMQQARIRNDLGLFREMERGILDLLGVKADVAVAA